MRCRKVMEIYVWDGTFCVYCILQNQKLLFFAYSLSTVHLSLKMFSTCTCTSSYHKITSLRMIYLLFLSCLSLPVQVRLRC